MPAKKPPPKNEKPQRERFIEAARELEADETGKRFDDAIRKVLPKAQTPKDASTEPRKKKS